MYAAAAAAEFAVAAVASAACCVMLTRCTRVMLGCVLVTLLLLVF
jgi:hypothetical protein